MILFESNPNWSTATLNPFFWNSWIVSLIDTYFSYNAYSSILEQQKDIEGAKKYIDQALVLDPNFADAWSTKGRLIYNQAFYKEQESFNASGKELKLLEEEFIKLYEESIPYFQKAIELNPNDFESMKTLKSLYYKLSSQFHINKYDELYNQMQERLNNF